MMDLGIFEKMKDGWYGIWVRETAKEIGGVWIMQGPVTRLIMLDCMFSAMRTTEGFGAIVEVA